jgi:hypothetical protein
MAKKKNSIIADVESVADDITTKANGVIGISAIEKKANKKANMCGSARV